jgi:hypothetical protein
MANELEIQNLLTDASRSLSPVFKHWLSGDLQRQRRDEQILLYLQATATPAVRSAVLSSLSPGAQAALYLLIRYKEQVTVAELLADAAVHQYNVTSAHIGELHYFGVAFFNQYELWPGTKAVWSNQHGAEHIILPPGLTQAKIPIPAASPVVLKANNAVEEESMPACPELSEFLAHFLNCAGSGQVRLTQQDMFTARSKAILEESGVFPENSQHTAEKLLQFSCDFGIVKVDSTGTVVPLKQFAAFRQQKRAEEVRQYLDYCIKSTFHPKMQNDQYSFSLEYVIEKSVTRILGTIEEKNWLSIAQIIKIISQTISTAFASRPSRRGWSWNESSYIVPSLYQWKKEVIRYLEEWFYPAGVIVFGRDKKNARYVRLSSFGRFWLQEEYAPTHNSEHQKLIVQPDFTALLTHSGPWDYVAQVLGFFGTRSGDDNASVFRFSRESVQEALQHGHTIQKLLDILKKHNSYTLPDNVTRTLKEWGQLSSKATLHRDVNIFSFDTKNERDAFLVSDQSLTLQAVGERYVLVTEKEGDVLELMKQIHALPVDYTQPPTGGLEILPDGRVVCQAQNDIRITALRDALALPVHSATDNSVYYLSRRAMKNIKYPRYVYERLQKMPGKKLPVNTLLNILIYLGLLPECEQYFLLEDFTAARKNLLGGNVSWRKAVCAQVTQNTFVIENDMREDMEKALRAKKITTTLRTISLKKIPAGK